MPPKQQETNELRKVQQSAVFLLSVNVVVCLFVRHQFYLNASESYLAGRLRVSDRQLIAQITSLIVHAETRDRLKTTGQQVCIETG